MIVEKIVDGKAVVDPWRTESGSAIRTWYVMRADIEMSAGKFAIQIGHGTDFIHMRRDENPYYSAWIDPQAGNRRKTVLRAKTLADLQKVAAAAAEAGLLVDEIWDAGLTEFGEATMTGLLIHPHDDAKAPKPLKRLQAWKSKPDDER